MHATQATAPELPDDVPDWCRMTDAELERQCDRSHYRASGPGGQHRNKTDSAVRLVHRATGLTVTATERRSQHENRIRAVARMREALAFQWRQPLDHAQLQLPTYVRAACSTGRIRMPRGAVALAVYAWLLDCLQSQKGQLSTTAQTLGVSTASLVHALACHDSAWESAQQIRTQHKLPPLKRRD